MVTTAETLRTLLEYNPVTGVFVWRARAKNSGAFNSNFAGKIAGNNNDGYWQIEIFGKAYKAHRLAWLYVYGEWPPFELDHENRNKLDNKIKNLRKATRSQNEMNKIVRSDSKSGIKGVWMHKRLGRWTSQINLNGKKKHLGLFDTPEEAGAAYQKASAEMFGEYAVGARAGF